MQLNPFVSDKILYHPERIAEFIEKGSTMPITWELDLTNKCNHNCPQCAGGRDNSDILSEKEAMMYIHQIASLDAKAITFTGGGECLLAPFATEAIQLARKFGMDVALITNGSLIKTVDYESLVENCTWIRVSLDASTEEMFKRTHGCNGKTFRDTLDGINKLVLYKQQKKLSCSIGVAFLTDEETKFEMLHFTQLCKYLEVDYVQFRPFHFDKTSIGKELNECLEEETPYFKVLSSQNKYQNIGEPRPYPTCYGHHFAGVINVHEVYLCCHLRDNAKYKLGDLREQPLRIIWDSKKRKDIYEHIDNSDCVPVCRCDPFNQWLWKLKNDVPTHVNFL